jgi:hypothetical protein
MSAIKLATPSSGSISLTPADTASNLTITVPAVSGSFVTADTSGNVGIGTASPSAKLNIVANDTLNAGVAGAIIRQNGAAGNNGLLVDVTNTVGAYVQDWRIGNSSVARLDLSGNLLVGTTSNASGSRCVFSSSLPSGGSNPLIRFEITTTANAQQAIFVNGNGQVGSINTSGTATSYITSSDYRLKENIAPMTGALAKVSALKPCTYTWKADGSAGQGFIAHELQEVVPDCVTGEKDAVDAEGNPKYQGIDTSFLVATLTAAIQEQQEIITQLQADVAQLKGQAL